MKQTEAKVLGHTVQYNVPQSVEEYNSLDTKRENACLEDAIDETIYRKMNNQVRYLFLHGREAEPAKDGKPEVTEIKGVEQVSGIERKTKAVMKEGKPKMKDNEPVTEWDESEADYYKRVLATLVKNGEYASIDLARASFAPLIASIANSIVFNPMATESEARGPKKLPIMYKVAAARRLLGMSEKSIEYTNEKELAQIGEVFTPSNDETKFFEWSGTIKVGGKEQQASLKVSDKDAEALGWLIKKYTDWDKAQGLNQ